MSIKPILTTAAHWLLWCVTSAHAIDIVQSNVGIGCSSVCIGTQCTKTCSGPLPPASLETSLPAVSDVKDFDAIRVEGGIDLDLGRGLEHSLTVFADRDRLQAHTRGGTLILSARQSPAQPRIKVRVTAPSLEEVHALGNARVEFSGFTMDRLSILTLDSAATVKGTNNSIRNAIIHGSGVADIDLHQTTVLRAEVRVAGAADVRLAFPEKRGALSGHLADASRLQVCGRPNRNELLVHDVAELVDTVRPCILH